MNAPESIPPLPPAPGHSLGGVHSVGAGDREAGSGSSLAKAGMTGGGNPAKPTISENRRGCGFARELLVSGLFVVAVWHRVARGADRHLIPFSHDHDPRAAFPPRMATEI